jgi:hypothetical protein
MSLGLDYYAYTKIKRDILDNGYFENHKNEYQVLLKLLFEARELEERKIIDRLEDELIDLDWSDKLKACNKLLTEIQHEWVQKHPESNLTDQRVEDWLYENIYERVFDYYKEDFNKYEPSGYDPLLIYKEVGKTLKDKISRIGIMIEFNLKRSDKISFINWLNFSNSDWLKKIKEEVKLVSEDKRKEFLLLLSGHFRADSFNIFPTPKGNNYVNRVNQSGELNATEEVFNKDTLADAIINISFSKPKKKIKLNYEGSPNRLVHGFTKYQDIYWRIDDVESFVFDNFRFSTEEDKIIGPYSFKIKMYIHALTKVIREIRDSNCIENTTPEIVEWLYSILNPDCSSRGSIENHLYTTDKGFYSKPIKNVKIDLNDFL